MATCTIKKSKFSDNRYCFDVQLKNLSQGEVFALRNALKMYMLGSPVARDLLGYIENAEMPTEISTLFEKN